MRAPAMLSIVCAVLAAGGNATANVMLRKASLTQPAGARFDAGILANLIRRRVWLYGFGGMVASFLLQAVALSNGQLSAVEPIITLEVPLTLLVASRVFRTRLGHAEWIGILTMTAGMIVLVGSLDPQTGHDFDVSHETYVLAGGATAATIGLLIAASLRGPTGWRTACLGAATGTSFGLTATLIKETMSQLTDRGWFGVVSTWQTYAAIGFGILGVLVMQWALHTGPLLASQPGFTLMDPIVSILWGVLVFGETTRTGLWLVAATLGTIAIGVGVVVLARSPLLGDENAAAGPSPVNPARAAPANLP